MMWTVRLGAKAPFFFVDLSLFFLYHKRMKKKNKHDKIDKIIGNLSIIVFASIVLYGFYIIGNNLYKAIKDAGKNELLLKQEKDKTNSLYLLKWFWNLPEGYKDNNVNWQYKVLADVKTDYGKIVFGLKNDGTVVWKKEYELKLNTEYSSWIVKSNYFISN